VCAQHPHSDMESSTHDGYPVPANTHVILERDVGAAVHSEAVVCEQKLSYSLRRRRRWEDGHTLVMHRAVLDDDVVGVRDPETVGVVPFIH
jgi:hypothetical protein